MISALFSISTHLNTALLLAHLLIDLARDLRATKTYQKHKVTAQSKVRAVISWCVLSQKYYTLHSSCAVKTPPFLLMRTQNELNMHIFVIPENRCFFIELHRERVVT